MYLRLIPQEAGRNAGDGWRLNDTRFRQLAAADATANWGVVSPGLYAQTFVALGRLAISRCVHCIFGDHVAADCALVPLAPVSKPKVLTVARCQRERAPADKPICRSYNAGRCTFRDCSSRHVCANCKGQHRMRGGLRGKAPAIAARRKDKRRVESPLRTGRVLHGRMLGFWWGSVTAPLFSLLLCLSVVRDVVPSSVLFPLLRHLCSCGA